MNKLKLFSYLLPVVVFFTTCATNPVTGKKQFVLMSEEQEIAMGMEADPQIVAQYGLYEDSTLQRFINEKGKKMAAISHRPHLNYNFRIVDSDILNAFAVPGGYVYFTRGIMAHFNNEAEFAGVLGHEIGHITARHSVAQQSKQVLGQIGLIGAMIIKPELAQFGEAASQGLGLLFLKFGRDAESESDRLGVEYSSKINYDAHQMANFFNTLKRQGAASGGEELPTFLSTHPDPADRNIAVDREATAWQQKLNLAKPDVNRNVYLKRIEGLVYGEDPRQGYFENNAFYHPGMKIQFVVPSGWKYQNTPSQVQMAPQDGQALMYLTFAPGKTVSEAAETFVQKNNLQAQDYKETVVNGYKTFALIADTKPNPNAQQQTQTIRAQAYFYQYGETVLLMIGLAAINNFAAYQAFFSNTQKSFAQLTDQSKINKKPERVRIKTLKTNTTFAAAMKSFGMPEKRMEELAILNGMKQTDVLEAGTLIKVIGN